MTWKIRNELNKPINAQVHSAVRGDVNWDMGNEVLTVVYFAVREKFEEKNNGS